MTRVEEATILVIASLAVDDYASQPALKTNGKARQHPIRTDIHCPGKKSYSKC